jgi:CRP-like cAMP-binding protein
MVPIANLNSGAAFGELALLKDQPRSASIKCTTNCHMAVLVKEDYMKIIGRAEEKILDKQIDFLKEIPFFAKWSKRKLEKLNYYFSTKKYSRKQVVFHHSTPANFVYIVKSGEFELTRPMVIEKDRLFSVKVALLGRGEIYGDEEVALRDSYLTTCTCYSSFGELLCINADNFLMKFYNKPDSQDDFSKKIKNEIRENRLIGFRNFWTADKPATTITISRQSGLNRLTKARKVKSIQKKSESVRFSPLNTKQLETIKSRALGISCREKLYINLNTPYETLPTEENEKSIFQKDRIFSSFHEMISHQPGGYYRGRLKRPNLRIKSLPRELKSSNITSIN